MNVPNIQLNEIIPVSYQDYMKYIKSKSFNEENNYTLKGRTMFAKCLDKVCLGKLMILTIKSLQNAQLLTRNVEELS